MLVRVRVLLLAGQYDQLIWVAELEHGPISAKRAP